MWGGGAAGTNLGPHCSKRVTSMTCPLWALQVFSDRDLTTEAGKARVEAALARADILFASLLFDYDQVGHGLCLVVHLWWSRTMMCYAAW